MNLKDWEKIEEDDHTVTMKHPSGHMMTIAVMALPKIQREQIKRLKLAEGGHIDSGKQRYDNEKGVHKKADPIYSFSRSKAGEAIDQKTPKSMASRKDLYDNEEYENEAKQEHHKVLGQLKSMKKPNLKGLAHGGKVRDDKEHFANYNKMQVEKAKELAANIDKKEKENPSKGWGDHKTDMNVPYDPNYNETVGKRRRYDQGGGVQSADDQAKPQQDDSSSQVKAPGSTVININPGQPATAPQQPSPLIPQAAPIQAQQDQSFGASVAPQIQQVPTPIQAQENGPKPQMLTPDNMADVPKAVALEQQAADERVPIEAEMSQAKARALDRFMGERGEQADRAQKNADDLQAHADEYAEHLRQTQWGADPNRYFKNMGGGERVATAIGLFLGGLGAQFSGGRNFASDFLNQQINRDVEAQKEQAANQRTVWGAYEKLYGNQKIANEMATAASRDRMVAFVDREAARLNTPSAAIAAKAFKADQLIKRQENLKNASFLANTLPAKPKPSANQGTGKTSASMAPNDSKWGDQDLKPEKTKASSIAPKTNPARMININYDKMNQLVRAGAAGSPDGLSPAEAAEARTGANAANSANLAIKEIHKQFPEMWKNATVGNDAIKYIGSQHLNGVHLPDITNWATEPKRYMTAASAVKKVLANMVAGGGSEELYNMIESQLPTNTDSASDYRQKLENVEFIIRQDAARRSAILKQKGLASGLD